MELLNRVSPQFAWPHAAGGSARSEQPRQEISGLRHGTFIGVHRASLPVRCVSLSRNTRPGSRPGSVLADLECSARSRPRFGIHRERTKKRTGADSGAISREAPAGVIERLRKQWAFATSIDGLGLSPERFWRLSLADYNELKAVRDEKQAYAYRMWAIERVEFRNAHQLFGAEGVPWEISDLLTRDLRHERAAKVKTEKTARDMEFMKLQRGLASVTKDSVPEEKLPSWAVRQWDPKDYPELFK